MSAHPKRYYGGGDLHFVTFNRRQEELFFGASLPRCFWQARFYDFNVWTAKKRIERLRYMHRNPVTRGLVASAEQWRWSSFRAYALGEKAAVAVNAMFPPKWMKAA